MQRSRLPYKIKVSCRTLIHSRFITKIIKFFERYFSAFPITLLRLMIVYHYIFCLTFIVFLGYFYSGLFVKVGISTVFETKLKTLSIVRVNPFYPHSQLSLLFFYIYKVVGVNRFTTRFINCWAMLMPFLFKLGWYNLANKNILRIIIYIRFKY